MNLNLTYFYTWLIRFNSRKENCLVIEDALLGVEAAKRARMTCIALTTTYGRDKLTPADPVVKNSAQIDLSKF